MPEETRFLRENGFLMSILLAGLRVSRPDKDGLVDDDARTMRHRADHHGKSVFKQDDQLGLVQPGALAAGRKICVRGLVNLQEFNIPLPDGRQFIPGLVSGLPAERALVKYVKLNLSGADGGAIWIVA